MSQKEIIKELNSAWLNLTLKDSEVINPLERLRKDDSTEFYKRLTCLFMNPDYFSFICKHVLNIDLLPMQALILKECGTVSFQCWLVVVALVKPLFYHYIAYYEPC